ncbi:MAG: hypothetical protein KF901_11025 [Myxococcales bacterium]|nr:hypothetical protein [Myxococcales bacterium]
MSWIKWMCALALVGAVACGGGNEEEAQRQAEELAAQLEGALNMAAEQLEQANEATAEAAGDIAEATTPGAPGAGGLEELGAALGAALEAAGNAEGGEPCEQAYNGAVAMIAALSKNMPGGMGGPNMPSRDTYLSACRQLPADAQQCSVPAYAMANQETCQTVMQRPDVQQKIAELQRIMQGGGN